MALNSNREGKPSHSNHGNESPTNATKGSGYPFRKTSSSLGNLRYRLRTLIFVQ
jgi:hypothetical protein